MKQKAGKLRFVLLSFLALLVFAIATSIIGINFGNKFISASAAVDPTLAQDSDGSYILEDEDNSNGWFNITTSGSTVTLNGLTSAGFTALGGIYEYESDLGYIGIANFVVKVPSNVTDIATSAFEYCKSLTNITIPSSVTSIGDYAFSVCRSLTSIAIPAGVTEIGESAFSGCRSLKSISIPASLTSIKYGTFSMCESLTSISIPAGVTEIGECAFSGCTALTSISLSDSVTSIGSYAFSGCTTLTNITIPSSVTTIGKSAFNNCTSLESITVAEGNTKYYTAGNCLIETESGTIIRGVNNSVIPADDNVTKIGDGAFNGCSSLTSIAIPAGVTEIGERAFEGCTALTSITIPASLTAIGWYAFRNCASFTSISIPAGVTSIGSYAFSGCTTLTNITIPSSVTSMGTYIFRNCTSLTSIAIPAGETEIGSSAFSGCTALTSITIPSSITRICTGAFNGCNALSTVYYDGTPEQFNAISVSSENDKFTAATKKYAQHVDPSSIHDVTITYGDRFNISDAGIDIATRPLVNATYSGTDAAGTTFTDQAFNGVSDLNAGTYTFKLTLKDSNQYWAATDGSPIKGSDGNPVTNLTFKLTIKKKTISSLDWQNTTAIYSNSTVPMPYALYDNGKYIALATIDDHPDGVTEVGEYTATIKDLGVNYDVTCSKSTTFKVTPALAEVKWNESASTGEVNADGNMKYAYTGGIVVPGLSVEFAGPKNENQTFAVTLKKADGTVIDLNTATALDAGIYTLTVTLNDNYAVAKDKTASLTYTYEVANNEITVAWIYAGEFICDGKAHNPIAYYTDDMGRMVRLAVVIKKGDDEVANAIEEGEYTAELVTEGLPFTISEGSETSVSFKIKKQSVAVVWTLGSGAAVYNGEAQCLTAAVSGVDDSELVYTYTDKEGNEVVPVNVGVYNVSVETKSGEVLGNNTFTINKAKLSKPFATVAAFGSIEAAKEYLPLGYDANTMALTGVEEDGKYVVTVSIKDAGNYEWTDGSAETVSFTFDIGNRGLKAADGGINWLVIGIIAAIIVVALISLIALILAFKKRRSQDSGNAVVSSDDDGFYDPYVE